MVSSYAIDAGYGVLLFDPLAVPEELRERATAGVLTCAWHRRGRAGTWPPDLRATARPAGSGPCPRRGVFTTGYSARAAARLDPLDRERTRAAHGAP
jgi:hypothetical protein